MPALTFYGLPFHTRFGYRIRLNSNSAIYLLQISSVSYIDERFSLPVFQKSWSGTVVNARLSVAASDKSFSKLKFIKTYLRSTMSQDRLVGLATMPKEWVFLLNIQFEEIMKEFVDKEKGNRSQFLNKIYNIVLK
ncbi:hypothetical protein AVEN_236336-1 [Araneus ventricosus]|uniref:HAT C-terminal dimerisation domain-containing protein n=1 Tax=Araneus ventricosus TaxID=182803 RepID=A0A4Y2QVL7_ARAVE|nr:hypothetical protein AVEN_236336-1 [Araneus ventricosus]